MGNSTLYKIVTPIFFKYVDIQITAGLSNWRPAGRIRPAGRVDAAREAKLDFLNC